MEKNSPKSMLCAAIIIVIVLIIPLAFSGCISWNVRTTLESRLQPDGELIRSGKISLKEFNTDSLDNRYLVPPDTMEARVYINSNYVPAPQTSFEGYTANPDSTYSVTWKLLVSNPAEWFWDYRRLAPDSSTFSGNRIKATRNDKFFRTEYEYNEIFFDAIMVDSIMAYLPEAMPGAADAFFRQMEKLAPSRAALQAAENGRDEITGIIDSFWDSLFKELLLNPQTTEGNSDIFDSLKDEASDTILAILSSYPGGTGYSNEIISSSLDSGETAIEKSLDARGFKIQDAYNLFGDDRFFFAVDLYMPGRIEATNSDSAEDNHLRWKFTNKDFISHELLLYARSSEYHWFRLIIAAFVVLVIIGLISAIARRMATPKTRPM